MKGIRIILVFFLLLQVNLKKKKKSYKREESVLVLNDNDFDKAIKHFKYVLVLFHASWCGHCMNFLPTFTKASIMLKRTDPKINLAKIEMSENKNTQTKYSIDHYPTLLFFSEGKASNYTGLNSEGSIAKWMRKMSQPHLLELNTLLDISDFKNTHEVAIIYFGENKDHLTLIQKFADEDGENYYANCYFQTAFSQYNTKPGMIVLYKNYGAERTELSGKLTEEGIENFIRKFSLNKIMPIAEKSFKYIWRDKHPVLILFRDHNDLKADTYDKSIKEVADKIKDRILLMISGISGLTEKPLIDLTNIKPEDLPCVRIYDTSVSYSTYYIMKGAINENNILNFISDWEKRKLTVPLLSEPVPQKQTGNIFNVVGNNFKKEIIESDRNCFVLFYRSGQSMSKTISVYEEVANRMKEYNNVLLIAQIDLRLNEARDIKINKYPSMKLFTKGKKSSPIDYEKEENSELIVNFLKINLNLMEDVDTSLDEGMEANPDL